MDDLLQRLNEYAKQNRLKRADLAERLGVPLTTLKHWFSKGQWHTMPPEAVREKIRSLVQGIIEVSRSEPEEGGPGRSVADLGANEKELRRRAEKVRMLLLLLEDELRWFRGNDKQAARDRFRRRVNAFDIGYISSLLSMLTEEEKYQRWEALTTYKFRNLR